MDRKDLESLPREVLIEKATALGVVRPRALTVPELIDEIVRVETKSSQSPRGWFGRARDLLTSVIDRGLGTDVRRATEGRPVSAGPPPIPTVTLAEIYAAQGHLDRAITTLDEVLAKDPNHAEAAALRERFVTQSHKTKSSTPPPVIVAVPEPVSEPNAAEAAPADVAPGTVEAVTKVETQTEPALDAAAEDEADLPPFEVDEIVALAVDPHTVYLYWEIRPSTFASARARDLDESGSLVIRVATVEASASPTPMIRDIAVDALFGELFLHGVPAEANVRVSVGYKTARGDTTTLASGAPVTTNQATATEDDLFVPYAVGSAITTPRATPTAHVGSTERSWTDAQAPAREPARTADGWTAVEGETSIQRRFPAGVWVDPSLRVVHVATIGTEHTENVTATQWTRGASELMRSDVVWGSETRPISSYVHAR